MSLDPSPWGQIDQEEQLAPTDQLFQEALQDQEVAKMRAQQDKLLWEQFANRMAKDGSIIR